MRLDKNGLPIFPTVPRTGMPSGVIGKIVVLNNIDRIKNKHTGSPYKASTACMGAACIISSGYGLRDGMAASMTVFSSRSNRHNQILAQVLSLAGRQVFRSQPQDHADYHRGSLLIGFHFSPDPILQRITGCM